MKKTLTIRPPEERAEAPALNKKGRGWSISESRLDAIHEAAREAKRHPTPAQTLLAEALAAAELGKYRPHCQVVIGSALVDFACKPLRVAIAIDEEDGNAALDQRRDRSLAEVGIKLLRFPAAAVLADVDAVVATITAELKANWQDRRARPSRPVAARPRGPGSSYQR
jgi:very-short-patch-repair endonuclease